MGTNDELNNALVRTVIFILCPSQAKLLSTGWIKDDPFGEHHLYWSQPPDHVSS